MNSLSALQVTLDKFGNYSDLRENKKKSSIYPVSVPPLLKSKIQEKFQFKQANQSFIHLGITIPVQLNDLFKLNYATQQEDVQQKF